MTMDEGDRLKHVFDVAMAPIVTFNFGYGCWYIMSFLRTYNAFLLGYLCYQRQRLLLEKRKEDRR